MYLNDLNSSQHNVEKLNRILADTFKHDVDLSEMSTDSLNRMLTTTNSKRMEIKESDLKYWENPQYNKLGLIAHQIKTYLSEIAPTRNDGKKMKKESRLTEADLDQAEVLLAAQELVDELQKMVEDVAEMQVQKLMPIVDAMKEQIGFDVAEAYNNAADAALGGLLGQMKTAKEAVENATLAARGEPVPGGASVPTDMGAEEPAMDADAGMDMPADEFGGDEAEAGDDNAVGRELKGESALADMEGKALSEKKFLESKDRLFKMVESGKMTQEHFINIINQLDEDPMILGIPQTSPKGPGMPKGDPMIHGTPKKRKGPGMPKGDPMIHGGDAPQGDINLQRKGMMNRFRDADRRSSQRDLPNTPTPDDMARDRFKYADKDSMKPTPDDMGKDKAPGMPRLTDPGSLLDPKRGPNRDAQGKEIFPSIPKAGITGADRAPKVGDLRPVKPRRNTQGMTFARAMK